MKEDRNIDPGKLDADGVKIVYETENPFLKKLSNFWYYHKWKVIIISFFAIIAAVGIYQMVTREDVDEVVVIAASTYLENDECAAIDNLISSCLPKNKDGSVRSLEVYDYTVYSEEDIEEANHSETDSEGRYVVKIDRNFVLTERESYDNFMQTGESSVLFLCPDLYYSYANRATDPRMTMSELFGDDQPVGVMDDGCGIRLGDTEIYKYYEELQVLPEDTVICVLHSYYMGASSNKEKHDMSVELFKNIVNFGS